ncbi:hypothetical protein NLU13_7655 [Sarocladium strictum]|uniref:Uncharacterized protein n=1 Tax=Sarocladium strictum TaxID=5046 RepID=A0AA39GD76_SARSR|nr:hypothetical protein NLU13_7655 [Sarocladium strictum]
MRVTLEFPENSPEIYNGGEAQLSTTSLPNVGTAVVGLLPQLEEIRTRAVWRPRTHGAPVDLDLDVVADDAVGRFCTGTHDFPTIIDILLKSIMHPNHGSKFVKNDNELSRMEPATEEYLTELIDTVVPASYGQ